MSTHISSTYHFSERIKSQSHVLMCPKSTWKGEDYDVIDIPYNWAMRFLLKGSQYLLKFQSIYMHIKWINSSGTKSFRFPGGEKSNSVQVASFAEIGVVGKPALDRLDVKMGRGKGRGLP